MTESLLDNFEKENLKNENNNLQADKSLYLHQKSAVDF